jgi:hypothetical protein
MATRPVDNVFILSAFDRDQCCPVLQTRFSVTDLSQLTSILGELAVDDPRFEMSYVLDDELVEAINQSFSIDFRVEGLDCEEADIFLYRPHSISRLPYLVHTGYELFLLLEGRKKLARMSDAYPPDAHMGEDRFDRWVDAGALHKEVVVEAFDKPHRGVLGHRTVYYTPPNERWRIPAMKMLTAASGRTGGWNEYFERLEGMLFGYSDEENDWWINVGVQGGGFGGVRLCCGVDLDELAWIEAAGFRALPPKTGSPRSIAVYDRDGDLPQELLGEAGSAAIVRFNVLGKHLMNAVDLRDSTTWMMTNDQIAQLNRHIRGLVEVVARRGEGGWA